MRELKSLTINETYNIHKKINCIFPFLKLKILCHINIHNYMLTRQGYLIFWKCYCCGKEMSLNQNEYEAEKF